MMDRGGAARLASLSGDRINLRRDSAPLPHMSIENEGCGASEPCQ